MILVVKQKSQMVYFCPICQDSIVIEKDTTDPNITILRCDHTFHTDCLMEWIRHSGNTRCVYCNRYPNKMTCLSYLFIAMVLFDVTRAVLLLRLMYNYHQYTTEVLSSIHIYLIIDLLPFFLFVPNCNTGSV